MTENENQNRCLLVLVTAVRGREGIRILQQFRLDQSCNESNWDVNGERVTILDEASLVVLCPQYGADVATRVSELCKRAGLSVTAVIIHRGVGSSTFDVQIALFNMGNPLPDWWNDKVILVSFTAGRVAGAVQALGEAITRGDGLRFKYALDWLNQAALAALGPGCDFEDRSRRLDDRLPADFDRPPPPVSFVYHRLSGTLGALLTALQDWEEHPEAESIKDYIGRGRKTWEEIRALVAGEGCCEWQQQTNAKALVDLLPLAPTTLGGHFNKLAPLETFLSALDTDLTAARQNLLVNKWSEKLRAWVDQLDRIVRPHLPS